MSINIYKDTMMQAYLFGTPVLYSDQRIPAEDVPQYWSRYDLCGTARNPDMPYALVDQAENHYIGSILSPLTLKKEGAQKKLVKDKFELIGIGLTLAKFCADRGIHCPKTPIRHQLRPASPSEAGFFYALPPEKDEELGAIGHVRIDFGHDGKEFWHTWCPRGPEALNSQEFKNELGRVEDDLRKGVLKSFGAMQGYCFSHGGEISGGHVQNHGFVLETGRYLYRLRCNPVRGDYNAYLSCFDKLAQKQTLGLTEQGQQKLQDVANPDLVHNYSWYVIENINTPGQRVDHNLPLLSAIQLYMELDCEDKRLGVTKDDIAAVDLIIQYDGREWISEDRLKMDGFKDDPVVADACARLRQMLEAAPLIGRICFANGESEEFTDPEKYIQAIREELPYHPVTGFRCETLTDDPAVHKAVDDLICDLYGEENPRQAENYGQISGRGMTMGGMIQ